MESAMNPGRHLVHARPSGHSRQLGRMQARAFAARMKKRGNCIWFFYIAAKDNYNFDKYLNLNGRKIEIAGIPFECKQPDGGAD